MKGKVIALRVTASLAGSLLLHLTLFPGNHDATVGLVLAVAIWWFTGKISKTS